MKKPNPCGSHKLNYEIAKKVREKYATGQYSQTELSDWIYENYNIKVVRNTLSYLLNGKTWGDASDRVTKILNRHKICKANKCENTVYAKELCKHHYKVWLQYNREEGSWEKPFIDKRKKFTPDQIREIKTLYNKSKKTTLKDVVNHIKEKYNIDTSVMAMSNIINEKLYKHVKK